METYQIPSPILDNNFAGERRVTKLTPIFRDREELPTSAGLSDAISSALKESKYLIVICSPNAAKSEYVNREVIDFKHIHGEGNVLAIIVEGEPFAMEKTDHFNPKTEAFPQALKYRIDKEKNVTGETVEPIAADAREIGDGKERAKIKLIAGLLGVGFDDLWKREKRRKKRQKVIVLSLTTVLFIVISSLTMFSLFQWKEAEQQRTIALDGRVAAEKLVDHTLFNLRDILEPMGKLNVLRSTQEAVDNYYSYLENMELSLDDKFRIATYHTDSGYYYLNIGKIEKAKTHFEIALTKMTELNKHDNTNMLYQQNLAIIYSAIGSLYKVQMNLNEAKENYTTSERILKQLKQSPNRKQIQYQIAKNDSDMAHILQQEGEFDNAKIQYQKSIDKIKNLSDKNATNYQRKFDLAVVYTNYGTLLEFLNEYEEALKYFQGALKIREKLVQANPNNKIYEHGLWESNLYVGSVYFTYFKNIVVSKKHFEKALSIIVDLTAYDPINSQWQLSLARSYKKLGDFESKNKIRKALDYYKSALNVLEKIIQKDSKDLRIEYEYILYCGTFGNFLLSQNNSNDAKQYFKKALSSIQKLIKKDPSKTLYQYTLAMTYGDLATLYMDYLGKIDIDNFYSQAEHYGEKQNAQKKGFIYLEKSFSILDKLKRDDPSNPIWKQM